jgi:glycerophosphoryl diester phosphodiesterase
VTFVTKIFAHRGYSAKYPENTMVAFQAAEKVGADGIELDVQLSKDGEVVVIHDFTIDRTMNGKGRVNELTVEQLQSFHAKTNRNATIPTLKEVFTWIKTNSLVCIIELKNHSNTGGELEEKVVELVQQFDLFDRVIISSFNHYAIVYVYRLCPQIQIAPLYSEGLYMPWVYASSIHATSMHPNVKVCPDEIVITALKNGIEVRPYTVNDEKEMIRLYRVGCSAIFTDDPVKAKKVYNDWQTKSIHPQ